ncbi:hypothetical protein [Saccharothrix sp. ALI-22-I]|uniref:hypothetical protein n=1 Tax=Saccharothrix sp. ALI-22-I TaxID=1933778 RepID=UPI0015C3A7FE|nr:hypothetical protein [Saccharothrix sp. ALI-22-I]
MPAREFCGPFGTNLQALVAQYEPAQLDQFEDFLHRLRATMNDLLADQGPDPTTRSRP